MDELLENLKFSVQKKTDELISLTLKKIIKNNLCFIERNKKIMEIVNTI